MSDRSSDIGFLKREFRDARTVLSRLDHQVRRLVEPSIMRRPGRSLCVAPIGRADRERCD